MEDERITLNVGGKLFETRKSTLAGGQDTMFGPQFGGSFANIPDEKGHYFYDRDPKHFRTILNFLCDGSAPLPDGRCAKLELLAEATYFCVQPLVNQLKEALGFRSPIVGALRLRGTGYAAIFEGLQWPGGPVTVEFWVCNHSYSNSSLFWISNFEGDNQNRFQIHAPWGADKTIVFDYGDWIHGGGRLAHSISDDIIDKWQHIAVVSTGYNNEAGAEADGDVWSSKTLYLNGAVVAFETSASEPQKKLGDPPQELYFGGCKDYHIFPEQSVAEFRIWNTVRSASQIKSNMKTKVKGNEPGLWFYLPLQTPSPDGELVDLAGGKRAKLNLEHVVFESYE